MIYLVEHFFSIQGEGKHVGVPSIFFRWGGCNMQCKGFNTHITAPNKETIVGCDTAYAVDKKAFGNTWQPIDDVQTLIDILNSYALKYRVDIVMTGGEPLLFASDEIFSAFVAYLVKEGHRVTFETNASVPIDFTRFDFYKACTFAMAVKLSNSGEPKAKRINPKAIEAIALHAKESFFKFTLDGTNIEDTYAQITTLRKLAPDKAIYCMPISHSKEQLERVSEDVIEFCKAHAFIYCDRLHIRIWDAIQGV